MTTNYHTLDTVHLPRGLVWVDEFDWRPVESSAEYTLGGALVYESATRLAGRPITLQANDDAGWLGMTRAVVQAVYALAQAPGAVYVLTLADGRSFDVCFAPDSPFEARPVARPELPGADHPYVTTLRLIEV
ncbi:MAG: hypothetical protein RJB68_2520 [Pseudomonadota bacterium]|jgi:hypothetical protein